MVEAILMIIGVLIWVVRCEFTGWECVGPRPLSTWAVQLIIADYSPVATIADHNRWWAWCVASPNLQDMDTITLGRMVRSLGGVVDNVMDRIWLGKLLLTPLLLIVIWTWYLSVIQVCQICGTQYILSWGRGQFDQTQVSIRSHDYRYSLCRYDAWSVMWRYEVISGMMIGVSLGWKTKCGHSQNLGHSDTISGQSNSIPSDYSLVTVWSWFGHSVIV